MEMLYTKSIGRSYLKITYEYIKVFVLLINNYIFWYFMISEFVSISHLASVSNDIKSNKHYVSEFGQRKKRKLWVNGNESSMNAEKLVSLTSTICFHRRRRVFIITRNGKLTNICSLFIGYCGPTFI